MILQEEAGSSSATDADAPDEGSEKGSQKPHFQKVLEDGENYEFDPVDDLKGTWISLSVDLIDGMLNKYADGGDLASSITGTELNGEESPHDYRSRYTPEEAAKKLYDGTLPGYGKFNAVKILGNSDEYHAALLNSYIRNYDFLMVRVDGCLRWGFAIHSRCVFISHL